MGMMTEESLTSGGVGSTMVVVRVREIDGTPPRRVSGMRPVPLLLLLVAFFVSMQIGRAAHPLEEWQQRGPLPTSRELQDIADGEGRRVVVFGDQAGRALVSADGVNFGPVPLNLPPGLPATRILHGNGKWLLLAGGRVWSKADWSDAWTEGDSVPHGFAEIRSFGGEFWAWSAGGYFSPPLAWRDSVLYRSTDGLVWSQVAMSAVATDRFEITDMLYENGTYVVTNAGYPSPGGIWTSTDGTSWTGTRPGSPHYSVSYGNGRFVAGASGGLISISTDAVNWSSAQFPFIIHYLTNGQPGSSHPVYSEAREMVFSNGKFVALAQGFFGTPLLAESVDGVEWIGVTYGDGDFNRSKARKLRQIGDQTYLLGLGGNLWRTALWQAGREQLLPYRDWDWSSVAASGSRLVVAGEGGHVVWSDDADTFHDATLPDAADVTDLIWVPELALFVAVGGDPSGGRVWKSPDGEAWTSHEIPGFSAPATGVAWSGSQLLVCGSGGQLTSSADGANWMTRDSGTTESLTAIEWGGGQFVATGSGGIVIHSTDGAAWTTHPLGPQTVTYRGLVYGNGLWIVPDGYGLHLTTDLQNWWRSEGQAYGPNPLFAFGEFITTNQRYVVGSSDGSYWQNYVDGLGPDTNYSTSSGFTRGARFGNRVVFVGQRGHIGISGEWRDFFQEWKAAHFTAEELDLPEISGPDADPDHDGWSNLFEYAFNLNPKAREAVGGSRTSTYQVESEHDFSGTVATFTYPWAAKRPGVSVWAERSNDLIHWTRNGIGSDYPFHVAAGRLGRMVRLPLRSSLPEFIRLRAEIASP